MKIRVKTAIIFIATFLALILLLNQFFSSVLLASYSKVEVQEVNQKVAQIDGALHNQLADLNSKLSDWAPWNETYDFIENNNSAFKADSLNTASLASYGVNFMFFMNSSGDIVFSLGIDLENGTRMRVPASLMEAVSSDVLFALTSNRIFSEINSNYTSVVVIPQAPVLIAAQPIRTSEGTGPIRGAVIFGRYMDSQLVGEFSATLHFPVSLITYAAWQRSLNSSYASTAPSTYVRDVNSTAVEGYYVEDDITNRPAFVLATTLPRTTYDQGLATIAYIDISVAVACAAFGLAMFFLMEMTVFSRLRKLLLEVAKVSGQGDLSARISVSEHDEITSLGDSINNMLAKIEETSTRLQRSERFSAIGELATMVAHDLRNPLQAIANAAFFLKRSSNAGAKEKEILTNVESSVRYSDKIVNDLLDYSRDVRLELVETNPHSLLKETLATVTVPENIHVEDETESGPVLKVDVDKMKRVFINLINNAIDAMPRGGTLRMSSKRVDANVEFGFEDTGVGMSDEVVQKLFTPLFTTKAKGMGFGLAICKRIVEAHGGKISVTSSPGKGSKFTVSFPLNPKSSTGGESQS